MQNTGDLQQLPVPIFLTAGSAMQRYLYKRFPQTMTVAIVGDLADVARCFESVHYSQCDGIDAVIELSDATLLVSCREKAPQPEDCHHSSLRRWFYDLRTNIFIDQDDVYSRLRKGILDGEVNSDREMIDTVLALSQLPLKPTERLLASAEAWHLQTSVPAEMQRTVLSSLLAAPYAADALQVLKKAGWIGAMWPQLAQLDETEQGKSEHPEGNVWKHSLEALRHRKTLDLRVGLAILLHDIGKPTAAQTNEHRFHLHADLGADIARRMLRHMEFHEDIVADVVWLIRYHSFPGALGKLPTYRSAPLMKSRLFPLLLELYRCDLSATFRGPDGYYRACSTYRRFLKHHHNPFRDSDGKKLVKSLVD